MLFFLKKTHFYFTFKDFTKNIRREREINKLSYFGKEKQNFKKFNSFGFYNKQKQLETK